MKKIIILLFIVFLSAVAMQESIASVLSGAPIPSEIQTLKLSDVINNPAAYDGKKILLVGSVANFCATSGCHFTFQDSGESIDIYPKGFKLPKLKKGQIVKIYAEVKAGEKRVVIAALGLEVE